MNKKGESIILMIFELLVVVGVIFMALQTAEKFAKSDTVIKANVAQDMAMMVNALVGTTGNAVVAYPEELSRFVLLLDSKKLIVTKKEESEFKAAVQRFILPEGFTGEGVVEQRGRVCLEKKTRKIILRECKKDES